MKKYELYIISLSMLFLFVFFLTVPMCRGINCEFISFKDILTLYMFSALNLILFFYSLYLIFKLKVRLGANNHPPFKVKQVKNDSYEHLVFLVTYIVPLIAFNFSDYRYQVLFIVLLGVIGYMYSKTDMYFSNPSLAILGYSIYNIEAEFRGNNTKSITVLSRNNVIAGNVVTYIKISNNVYIGQVI